MPQEVSPSSAAWAPVPGTSDAGAPVPFSSTRTLMVPAIGTSNDCASPPPVGRSPTATDVAEILDRDAVCVRAGHHCTQPVMDRLGIGSTTRASFYLYTVEEEVERLIEGLHRARTTFAL